MTIYGAYSEEPKQYYLKDGTYKEYKKFFENELDCARYCIKSQYKYDTIYVEPDSEKLTKGHYDRGKYAQLAAMGH